WCVLRQEQETSEQNGRKDHGGSLSRETLLCLLFYLSNLNWSHPRILKLAVQARQHRSLHLVPCGQARFQHRRGLPVQLNQLSRRQAVGALQRIQHGRKLPA